MMGKMVIFDLDGTLLNTIADLGAAANHALELRGLPQHSYEEYKQMVGGGIRKLITNALPVPYKEDASYIDAALEDFLKYYRAHIADYTQPYPGIVELLEKLQKEGYIMAVASNKFQEGARTLVDKFFPGVPFACVLGGCDGVPLKPDPQVVNYAMSCAIDGCESGAVDAVMIGDSGVDIRTAHAAHIPSIAVSWGFRSVEELKEADYLAQSASELHNIIRDLL